MFLEVGIRNILAEVFEATTVAGHWNAIGLLPQQFTDATIYDMEDRDSSLAVAVQAVHKSDGFAVINHPFAECRCCD